MLSSLTCLRKRGSRFYRFRRFNGVGAVLFVILSGGNVVCKKTAYLKQEN